MPMLRIADLLLFHQQPYVGAGPNLATCSMWAEADEPDVHSVRSRRMRDTAQQHPVAAIGPNGRRERCNRL